MKKIVALILTIFMGFGIVLPQSTFAAGGYVMDNSMMEKMEFLKLLDIIPDYNELNADLSAKVTRADFASVVAKMIKAEEYSGETYYYDVPKNHWAFKEISALTQKGIVSGYSNKLFAPDNSVNMQEAYTVIIRALGLDLLAEQNGGYPSGYMSAASSAGLTKNISSGGEMTLGAMFVLLYNALDANVIEISAIKGNEISYKISEEETYLSIYRGIYKDKGVLESADGIGYAGSLTEVGNVCVSGTEYMNSFIKSDMLGEEIEFFYEKLDNGDDADSRKIVWARRTGKTETLNLAIDHDAEFDRASYELRYDGEKKAKTFKLDRGIKLVYNGSVLNSDLSSVLNKPRYNLKLVKGTGNTYEIAVVWAAENYLVKAFDAENEKIYDKLTEGRILELDESEYERFVLRFESGAAASFSDIEKDSVLSIYKSADNSYFEAIICTGSAEGVLSSISVKDGRKYYKVDGNEYYPAEILKFANGREPSVNENISLKLDIMGDVVYIESTEAAYLPGYIIKVSIGDDYGEDTLYVKYIDGSGTIKKVSCKSKIKLDGVNIKDMKAAYNLLDSGLGQFALIKCGADGTLKGIDTVENNGRGSEDILRVGIPLTTITQYRNSMGTYFWDKGVAGPDTIIFFVPTDSNFQNAKDSDFVVKNRYQIGDNTDNLLLESYKTKDKIGFEQFVVIKTNNSASLNTEVPVLVETVESVLNEDDEEVEEIVGWQGREKIKLTADSGFSFSQKGVGAGDVICCYVTPDGKVSDILLRYDYNEENPSVSNGNAATDNSNLNAYPRYFTGYVNDVVDGIIKVGYNSKDKCDLAFDPSFIPVLVYDSGRKTGQRAYEGRVEDAITPDMDYGNASLVFVNTVWVSPRCIIIYK